MTTATSSHSDAGEPQLAPVRAGEVVAEKYRVQETLGVGGMGVVVAARDTVLERRVAIKFLLPRLAGSETAVQRFVREARAATRITSEHVVRLLEIDKLPNGTPFFVMEYLEGRDLRAVLRDDGPLMPSTAVDYLLQALQAVAEGHLKGIVHRDIKPGNLFLTTRADGTPLIKVLDFGIAKRLEQPDEVEHDSLTSSDDVRLGSPAYMPPEQLQDPRDVDTRSDIWSIGATLYELVSGKPPFEGPSYVELVSRILSAPLKPISGRQPAQLLPDGLEEVLKKCLEKSRTLRYANAAELATALARFGSLDARMSLTRVTGLQSLPSPQAQGPRTISDSGPTCTTTLSVADVTPSSQRHEESAKSTADVRPNRSWVVVAGTAAIVAAALALRGSGGSVAPPPKSAPAAAPNAATPIERPISASSTEAAVVSAPALSAPSATAPVAAMSAAALPTRASVAQPFSGDPAARSAAEKVAPTAPPAADVFPTALRAQRAEPAPEAAAPTPAARKLPPKDQPIQPVSPDTKAGRSEEIERLIESRR
ncbi:MAG TPA: serine/threonine-protein kinase [Polyangiaceae bacterium]|nr:serine/threonine-protein kinase [Polyangiaceae bacterium]